VTFFISQDNVASSNMMGSIAIILLPVFGKCFSEIILKISQYFAELCMTGSVVYFFDSWCSSGSGSSSSSVEYGQTSTS